MKRRSNATILWFLINNSKTICTKVFILSKIDSELKYLRMKIKIQLIAVFIKKLSMFKVGF